MRIHEETYNALNELTKMCFEMNAVADNIYYNMADLYYNHSAELFHHSYAHAWPQVADMISDEMLKLNARPVRLPVDGSSEKYDNLELMMAVNAAAVNKVFEKCKEIVDLADLLDDVDIRIFGENLLNGVLLNYVKQADEWLKVIKSVPAYHFDIHFDDYTHFIPVLD